MAALCELSPGSLRIREQIAAADDKQRAALIERLCSVYRTANAKLAGVQDDLRNFALEPFNAILHKQIDQADSMIGRVAQTVQDVSGEWERLEFFLYQIEHEPARLKYRGQGIWQRYSSGLASSRKAISELGDLEPQLLKIVLGELESSLRTRDETFGQMYNKANNFWSEQEDEFRRLAERVYAEQKNSGRSVQHVAAYLYSGLGHHDRAIEMLLVAHASGLLTESGQTTLVKYLHEQKRWQESIAMPRPLISQHRENISYTVLLMRAFFHVDRDRRVVMLLTAADQFFRREGRWTEANMAQLAEIALECQLFSQAAGYYKEIIPLHERTQPNRGVGSRTLSPYYMRLSQAYSRLNQTANAVDAAASAIVARGSGHEEREQQIATLIDVLEQANDLDAYIQHLDAQAAATHQDSPIIRKALGGALLAKRQYKLAATQLKLAVELQPNDEETHDYLIRCYDELRDGNAAFQQLLRLAQVKRHDISVYERLANLQTTVAEASDPFAKSSGTETPAGKNPFALGDADPFADPFAEPDAAKPLPLDPKLQERVLTSIVEVMPNEAASHQKMAQIREGQDRWDDAILHWKQVHRICSLEPTGLLGLANAQIHQQHWDGAQETIRQLQAQRWPERFDGVDAEIASLLVRLGGGDGN